MLIRPETQRDQRAIANLVELAFGRPDEARLVDRLRRDGDLILSLVADADDGLVGHVLFSRMDAPFRALGLGPLAVAPAYRRRGIAQALVADGFARAAIAGWEGIFVLGDPAYYHRCGFDAQRAAGFSSPYAGPYLMVAPLVPHLPTLAGTISYAPAFADLD